MKTTTTRIQASVVLLAALIFNAIPATCQEAPPEAPDTVVTTSRDTYRLRLENVQFGRIEISIDGGEHFLLIGRVTKPATVPAPDKQALRSGAIVRGNADGFAVAVAAGKVIKILPAVPAPRGKLAECALITDIRPTMSLFGEFSPPAGTGALQELGRGAWRPLPEDYTPTDESVFAFVVTLPEIHGNADAVKSPPDPVFLARLADARKRLTAISAQYTGQALIRAQETKRAVVSGVVTLRPKLPSGEPEPIAAITYRIDGDIVSAQNSFPSAFGWDTTRTSNGEHVVEIRALSKYTTVVTRVRALVVVNNP